MLMYRPNENFMCLVQILLWYNRTYVYKARNNFKLIFHNSTLFVFHANIFISPNFKDLISLTSKIGSDFKTPQNWLKCPKK